MKARCLNSSNPSYPYYGARGIGVDERWLTFKEFESWASVNGYRTGLELDRIDNNLGYSPENCCWITHSQNMRNTRHNVIVSAFGESKTLKEWHQDSRCKVRSYNTLHSRVVRLGWNPEKAISKASRGYAQDG